MECSETNWHQNNEPNQNPNHLYIQDMVSYTQMHIKMTS